MAAIGGMDKFLLSMSPLMRDGKYCFLRLRSGLSGRRCRDSHYAIGKNTYYHVISCWSSLRSLSIRDDSGSFAKHLPSSHLIGAKFEPTANKLKAADTLLLHMIQLYLKEQLLEGVKMIE